VTTTQERRGGGALAALLGATGVSVTGNALTELGIPWFVLTTTGSAARAGVVAFCALAPVPLASAVLSPLIDRAGRVRVSVASDLACGAATLAIPLLQLTGSLRFWTLCALVAVTGFLHAPGDTARSALVPTVAERSRVRLVRAAGLYDGASRCASMFGAAAGGVLITTLGASRVLFVDAASFAVSALIIGGAGRRWGEGGGERAGPSAPLHRPADRPRFGEGFATVRRTPLLLGICATALAAQALDQGWSSVLLPDDVRGTFGSALALGLVETLFAAFASVGALAFGVFGSRAPRRLVYALAFLVVGAPRFFVAAGTHHLAPLAVTMSVEGLACGVLNPIVDTTVYETVPPRLRSTVLGAMNAAALAVAPIGGPLAGFAVSRLGISNALLAFGAVYALVTCVPAIHPAWQAMDMPERGRVQFRV
jgi:MFS family permease